MKTVKELLLERHQAMETRLDAARRKAVVAIAQSAATQRGGKFAFSSWLKLGRARLRPSRVASGKWLGGSLALPGQLRRFCFSMRWHLAGLSAVWVAILLLNSDYTPSSTVAYAKEKIPSARVLMAALLKNRHELIELTETPTVIETPSLPGRRSEIQPAIAIA